MGKNSYIQMRKANIQLLKDLLWLVLVTGLSCDSEDKESACNVGEPGLILGQKDPLEKGMATHSSILAWRILRTEEPCGLSL